MSRNREYRDGTGRPLALIPGWVLAAGLVGGIFLLLAGILHMTKKGKNAQEMVATWTDLVVAVDVLVHALET